MRRPGFTLAEVLIALAILGVLATFTIPKLLYEKQAQRRFAVAQETAAALSQVTQNHLRQSGNCFMGASGCNNNGTSSASSNPANGYNQLVAALDQGLNYIRRTEVSGQPYYYLPSGVTVSVETLLYGLHSPGQSDEYVRYTIFMDTTPEQVASAQFSAGGVDTQYARVFVFRSGVVIMGTNNYNLRTGGAYAPVNASVFDLKEHPGDTCAASGGTNCGLASTACGV